MAGASTSDPGDFFATLVQDHARIEVRLRAFEQAVSAVGQVESDAAALAVVAETLRYFATEGARHEALEEQTLFPRLRSLPEFKQILSALEFQHRMNAAEGQALAACVESFAPGSGRELRRLAYRFTEVHRGHAIAEERALFPLAASVLPPSAIADMGRELRERTNAAAPAVPPRT